MATTNVGSGVTSSGVVLNDQQFLDVLSGGTAIATVVNSGGEQIVSPGGMASGAVVNSGGTEYVSGGILTGTVVNQGGNEHVGTGGTASSLAISGGTGIVFSGGVADGSVVYDGGTQYVFSGGTASGTVVSSGGQDFVYSGGFEAGAVVSAGGRELILAGSHVTDVTLRGGVLELQSGADVGNTITFGAGGGTLEVDGITAPGATISGLAAGDAIDLQAAGFRTSGTAKLGAGNVLTVTEGAHTVTLQLDRAQNFAGVQFQLGHDATAGTLVTLGTAPCFLAGTRIATERGAVRVEDMRVGDRVVTVAGALRPVVWIGARAVDVRRHAHPWVVRPIRVRAHAFGDGLPERDLLLSPDHALFMDGVLIPVKHLANGASVAQERRDAATYYHVELDRHDVLLAEGLPAESYLDTGNRGQFANGGVPAVLHPDFAKHSWDGACAELCQSGPAVVAARRHLLARLPALGWRAEMVGLDLVASGRMVRLEEVGGAWREERRHRVQVPAGTGEVRLVSGSGVPAGRGAGDDDVRPLGVCLGGVSLNGVEVELEGPALASGFHPVETNGVVSWRWTDGDARLVLPQEGPNLLEISVIERMQGWVRGAAAEMRRIA